MAYTLSAERWTVVAGMSRCGWESRLTSLVPGYQGGARFGYCCTDGNRRFNSRTLEHLYLLFEIVK